MLVKGENNPAYVDGRRSRSGEWRRRRNRLSAPVSDDKASAILAWWQSKKTARELSAELGVSVATIYRYKP